MTTLTFYGGVNEVVETRFFSKAETQGYSSTLARHLRREASTILFPSYRLPMKEGCSKISQIIKQTSGLVLADFAWGDINRLNSFYRATRQNNRLLAVAMKQAHLTDNLSKDPNLRVPDLAKKDALISRKAKKRYFGWEQEALKRGRVVDSSEIAKM